MKSLLPAICLLFSLHLSANNIIVSNVSLTGQNIIAGANNAANYVMVQFSVSWENSWRTSLGAANHDAAWIFIKYRVSNGTWTNAFLNNTGHTAVAGSVIDVGLLNPASPFHVTFNPGVGTFIYRNSNGSGTFTANNLQLRWNYGRQGLADITSVEIQVYAIEMVYIPQGAFNAGGGGGTSAFISTTINTANATTTPSGTGSLGGQAGGYPTGESSPVNANWPNGFAAFYCMKYEVSQQQYVDYLNSLTRFQQQGHVAANISGTVPSSKNVMTNITTSGGRSGIRCASNIPASGPVTFYCDMNYNDIGDEANDGHGVPLNFDLWNNLMGYLDWSGLRPMTELEFEKVCRGTQPAVPGEFAWGNTNILGSTSMFNEGYANEIPNPGANVALSNIFRVGAFAGAATTREQAGAGYYGVMEMSGNVSERLINISSAGGRSFQSNHGDGNLGSFSEYNVLSWPDHNGGGLRGGAPTTTFTNHQISDRSEIGYTSNMRNPSVGGRGVRSTQ